MVTVAHTGRRKLHALASSEVATAIEALAAISPLLPAESLRQARTSSQLQIARVCYSHLGGSLATALTYRLVTAGTVDPLAPGEAGIVHTLTHPLLVALDITELPQGSGPAVRGCLDWTERTPHLAGRLGSALLTAMLDHHWVARRPRDRALTITETGTGRFAEFGV
jgi:hypothetical protein